MACLCSFPAIVCLFPTIAGPAKKSILPPRSLRLCPSDPVKTAAGALSLKAYRLTKQAMELVKDRGYFNFDMLRNLKIGHENMFQELKVRAYGGRWSE